MCYDATYACDSLAKERSFTSEFIGLPNGKLVIIPDYQFIGKTTKHPQEAYDFAKFMSLTPIPLLLHPEVHRLGLHQEAIRLLLLLLKHLPSFQQK